MYLVGIKKTEVVGKKKYIRSFIKKKWLIETNDSLLDKRDTSKCI